MRHHPLWNKMSLNQSASNTVRTIPQMVSRSTGFMQKAFAPAASASSSVAIDEYPLHKIIGISGRIWINSCINSTPVIPGMVMIDGKCTEQVVIIIEYRLRPARSELGFFTRFLALLQKGCSRIFPVITRIFNQRDDLIAYFFERGPFI